MPAIHFLSDYGLGDEFVGVVHAVLHRLAPSVPVIDLTHGVPPFDVAAGAGALARAAPHLGAGAVLAVVDPGVATRRRALAVQVGSGRGGPSWLVGPDNGLLVPALELLGGPDAVYVLSGSRGSTFDGRDLFAPAVAHLVTGGDPGALGDRADPVTLVPAPPTSPDRVEGTALVTSVAHVDIFGNVQLRAGAGLLHRLGPGTIEVEVTVGTRHSVGPPLIARRVTAFAELGPGELGILIDASGHLALVLDRAAASGLLDLGGAGPAPTVRLSRPT
ncbi:MAG: S-adenosyl-l-methionine hydroxide adenosyltransferase family protein [Acidimicrobiales bacterium]